MTAMEYYLDTDPGVGMATSVTISSGTTFDETFTIPSGSLTEGFHTLVIRVRDDNLVWSVQESKYFYVSASDPIATATVDGGEYFIDTDPGIGSATSFSVSSGTSINSSYTIPSASISEGFHTLGLRLQDSDGVWGMQETRSFFAANADPIVVADVVGAEYYIDTDPGVGLGNSISITSGTNVDFTFTIPSSEISEGFHVLGIRTQDSGGQWSMQETKALYATNSDLTATSTVVAAEYYLDSDPGVGLGTAITVTSGTSVNFGFTIPSADLTEGFHVLVIRTQDDQGLWGMQEAKAIYVSNTNPLATTMITQLEYFIDADPGVGSGTAVDIIDAVDFNVDLVASTSLLDAGMHTIYFRAQDEMGVWSIIESKPFLVDPFISAPLDEAGGGVGTIASGIASFEYFIDIDPGYGLANQFEINPAEDSIDVDFTVPTDTLSEGIHVLGIRMINEFGLIGQTELIEFSLCTGADVQIAALTTCIGDVTDFTDNSTGVLVDDVYSWDFDGDDIEDDNAVGNVSHTFLNTGTYSVRLTISNDVCTASGTIDVEVVDLPIVVANASANPICAGDELTLTGSGAETYTWDNSVTDGTAFVPTETLTYTMTGTDVNGCVNTDMIEIPISTVDQPSIMMVSDNGRIITLTSSSETGNQWYEDGVLMEGETDNTVTVERTYTFGGQYQVSVAEGDCISDLSEIYDVLILASEDLPMEVQIWPNPASHQLMITGLSSLGSGKFKIVDLSGVIILEREFDSTISSVSIPVSNIQSGIYLLLIDDHPGYFKFVKK